MVSALSRNPALPVLDQLVEDNFLLVQRISHEHEDLLPMLEAYRAQYGIKEKVGPLDNALWYASVNSDGKLLSAVGLEENYNSSTGLWLFVRDFVVADSKAGLVGLGEVASFLDAVPYMMRGAVATNNPRMRAFYLGRGEKNHRRWYKIFDIVETEALHGRNR